MLWFFVIGKNTSHQLATSSEILVANAQFLVALATSESQFQALILFTSSSVMKVIFFIVIFLRHFCPGGKVQ